MFCWVVHQRRSEHHHVSVAVEHQVYFFGGDKRKKKDQDQIEVHVFNTVSLGWKKLRSVTTGRDDRLKVPSMRCGHTAVLVEGTIYLWGGRNSGSYAGYYYVVYYNVLHAFDVNTHVWVKPRTSGTVPVARAGHSACVLGKILYIYGGTMEEVSRQIHDIYKLDITTMAWSLIKNTHFTLRVQSGHSATIIGTKMFVFGGLEWRYHNNNISMFDTETDCWLKTPSAHLLPEGRQCHSAFAYHGELYIVGGYNGEQHFNDLWKFNPETFSWKKVGSKVARPSRITGCSMVGHRITVGGSKGAYLYLHVLDLSPSLKTLCKMTFIRYGLESLGLPHNIRWELLAMTEGNRKNKERPVRKLQI